MSLRPLRPKSFDSGLAPSSRLPDGAVEVVNVMTRRGVWTSSVDVVRGAQNRPLSAGAGEIRFVYVLSGDIRAGDRAPVTASTGQALVIESGTMTLAAGPDFLAIDALLSPAGVNRIG
jgi:environmental stress-induced protein Ves